MAVGARTKSREHVCARFWFGRGWGLRPYHACLLGLSPGRSTWLATEQLAMAPPLGRASMPKSRVHGKRSHTACEHGSSAQPLPARLFCQPRTGGSPVPPAARCHPPRAARSHQHHLAQGRHRHRQHQRGQGAQSRAARASTRKPSRPASRNLIIRIIIPQPITLN